MPLDGMFLHCQVNELCLLALNAKVDKIYQPSKEEIVLFMRSFSKQFKLLISARCDSPRICLTDDSYENPQKPPMFCMLLRKRLCGAFLTGITQEGLDRSLTLYFDATDEIGDPNSLKLHIEIMGTYSNVVLCDKDEKIIDCMKRTDSFVRQLYPGTYYSPVPLQDKINVLENSPLEIIEKMKTFPQKEASFALLSSMMGISPSLSKNIICISGIADNKVPDLSEADFGKLNSCLENFKNIIIENKIEPTLISEKDSSKAVDFSFCKMPVYGEKYKSESFETLSSLLDAFYGKRDLYSRMESKTSDLRRLLSNAHSRITKKLKLQKEDLKKCSGRETLRVNAELISANLYKLEKGKSYYEVENYYDNNKLIKINCNPALTPNQNAQKYYKEYKKTFTAEKMLTKLIEEGNDELVYIESVQDLLSRVKTEAEIAQIKSELSQQGYLKRDKSGKKKQKLPPCAPPIEYLTSDGFKVYVGRNNLQNDKLSLKTAKKDDMWLHVKDMPGSHVIIESKNGEISDTSISEAAKIAAAHSKADGAPNTEVDYTLVKNLKKPQGAKPGKVIYHVYNTIVV